jgi:hypothetical protein
MPTPACLEKFRQAPVLFDGREQKTNVKVKNVVSKVGSITATSPNSRILSVVTSRKGVEVAITSTNLSLGAVRLRNRKEKEKKSEP